jgi:acyl-[acyl carrier protein]--UDP-N-acetylglucosamine O-acyltransferase
MADFQERTIASVRRTSGEAIDAKSIMLGIKTTDGLLYKAADTANMVVVGRNEEVVAISKPITATPGKFLVTNSSTYPVTYAHIGSDCYIEDETTVASSGGTNSIVAGKVEDVVSAGVWVSVGLQ